MTTAGTSRRRRPLAAIAAAVIAAAFGATAWSGDVAAGSLARRDRSALVEVGTGTTTPDPCLDRDGRCGFVLKGALDGLPADETFFSVIQDDGAANDRTCVPARYAGLFGDGPDRSIGHVSDGRLCPDGSCGFVFSGRFRITGGLGPFEGIRGRGRIAAVLSADGTSLVSALGEYTLRTERAGVAR